jgi:DNA-binding protein HU-beta
MTKQELLDFVSEKTNMSKKQTGEVVDAVFAAVTEAIKANGRFAYPRFGTFTVRHRDERDGRNPRTNEPIKIKASNNVTFKAAPKLKNLINDEPEKKVEKKAAKKDDKKAAKKSKK